MHDGFGRTITYLRLSVTDLCNFRCRYCMPDDGVCKRRHEDILTVEECIEIAEAAAACGVSKVRLTGGEPLVRRGILGICEGIAKIPGITEVCLTTNGDLLAEMAADLKSAGVTRLNISLDTLHPERFADITRRDRFSRVMDGIAAAEAVGFSELKINTVLLGGCNEDEIPDFVELTRNHAWQVRFIELMPMGVSADWPKECFLPAEAVLQHCPRLEREGESGVASIYRIPGYAGTVGLITPMSHRFCASCDRIRVTADGRLKPCLHSDQEIPLKGLHGQALLRAMEEGIVKKPACHRLEQGSSDARRDMNEIGG